MVESVEELAHVDSLSPLLLDLKACEWREECGWHDDASGHDVLEWSGDAATWKSLHSDDGVGPSVEELEAPEGLQALLGVVESVCDGLVLAPLISFHTHFD